MRMLVVLAQWMLPLMCGFLRPGDGRTGTAQEGRADRRPPSPAVVPFDAEAAGRFQKAWAEQLGSEPTVTNGIGMELILIPPGEFEIEGEKVSLADAYYLGKTEVTQSQWAAVMGTDRGEGGEASSGNRPVAFVSWTGAMEFCERLTAKEERGTYRLPSEAEWEFACRAGTSTKYSFGEDPAELGQYAWISHNTRDAGEPFAHEVGLKKPNAFGLFDMHGNV